MQVCVWSDGTCQARVWTSLYSPTLNQRYHLSGHHAFQLTLPRSAAGSLVALREVGSYASIDTVAISTPGARIAAAARSQVGRAPYRYGGASPAGFDCSGFTLWAYRQAGVASLPHQSDQQRHVAYMRVISRAAARPGDLVFYLSGGSAYHVAVYAGSGRQYAASTPGQRIRYQPIWSSAVEFRTDWH